MDIVHRVGIQASPAQVYAALATTEGLSAWWTEDTRGQPAPRDVRIGTWH